MAGNPTGCMGLADYLGWDFRSAGGLPIVNVPGCPVQPENFMETLTWLLYQAAGLAPVIPLDEQLRPQWIFGKTVHEGCDRAGYYEQGDFATRLQLAQVPGQDRLLGPGRQLQRARSAAGWPASAAAPTSAASASAARCPASPTSSCRSWTQPPGGGLSSGDQQHLRPADPQAARHHQQDGQQGAEVAPQQDRADHAATSRAGAHSDHDRVRARATGTHNGSPREESQPGEPASVVDMSLGPDHPDRRQPRHLHEDRLRQPRGRASARARRRCSAATACS